MVRKLGEGGMGEVYEGRHVQLQKRVAIKTLHPHLARNPQSVARFLREGQAASRLQHPNVVDVTDVGVSDQGVPYLIMELLEGESLFQKITREAPVSVKETADLVIPIVAALSAAHEQGIIHRDIKPENIFLARSATGHLQPKLVDFGISKMLLNDEANLTKSQAVFGTPHYMAPEHAKGTKGVGPLSDLYSVGVLLYELCTGRRPVEGDSTLEIIHKVISGDFIKPRQHRPDVPVAFEAIILRCMASKPEARFQDGRALGLALLDFATEHTRNHWSSYFQNSVPPGFEELNEENTAVRGPSTAMVRKRLRLRQLIKHPIAKASLAGLGVALVIAVAFSLFRSPTVTVSNDPNLRPAAVPAEADLNLPVAGVQPSEIVPPPAPATSYRVRFSTSPRSATIFIDGTARGAGRFDAELPDGPHDILVSAEGFEDRTLTVSPLSPPPSVIALSQQRVAANAEASSAEATRPAPRRADSRAGAVTRPTKQQRPATQRPTTRTPADPNVQRGTRGAPILE